MLPRTWVRRVPEPPEVRSLRPHPHTSQPGPPSLRPPPGSASNECLRGITQAGVPDAIRVRKIGRLADGTNPFACGALVCLRSSRERELQNAAATDGTHLVFR